MIILWALVFVTHVVGLVITNQTSHTEVSNSWVQPPFMDASFVMTFEIIGHTYIDQSSVFDNVIAAFGKLCNTPYNARIKPQNFFQRGRDASIIELEGGRLLSVAYTMWAIYWCFFEIKLRPPIAFRYKEAHCIFGFEQPGGRIQVGSLRFVSRTGSTMSSSGSSMPDTNVDVTRRIKQRGKAASVVAASLNATDPSQSPGLLEVFDPAYATTNTNGAQGLSSVGNLTSMDVYNIQFRGNGPRIDLDRLLISILEALIDRASQSRVGPIPARDYRSVNGDYDISYGPSALRDTPELSYGKCILCFLKLMNLVFDGGALLREGDFTCLVNQREVLLGRFTRRADGNVGIATQ